MNKWIIGGIIGIVAMLGVGIFIFTPKDEQAIQVDNQELLKITESDHVRGTASASATLVEYADFQCPACASYSPIVDQLVAEYPNTLRSVYRHFPLTEIHDNAVASAVAAEAAHIQGKFWEYSKILFEKQRDWEKEKNPTDKFISYAKDLGLNTDQFKTDLSKAELKEKVMNSRANGNALKVDSTPTFYLNGKKIESPNNLAEFKKLIEATVPQGPPAQGESPTM